MDLVLSLQWVYAAWTANLKLKTTQHCWWLKKERKRNSTNECSNAPAKGRKGIMDVNIFTCIQMYSACLLADSEFWTTQWRQKHGPRTQVCQRKNILAAFWSESPENCNASEHKLQSERSSLRLLQHETRGERWTRLFGLTSAQNKPGRQVWRSSSWTCPLVSYYSASVHTQDTGMSNFNIYYHVQTLRAKKFRFVIQDK